MRNVPQLSAGIPPAFGRGAVLRILLATAAVLPAASCGRTGLLNEFDPPPSIAAPPEGVPDLPPAAPRLRESLIYPQVQQETFDLFVIAAPGASSIEVYDAQDRLLVSTPVLQADGQAEIPVLVKPFLHPGNLMKGFYRVVTKSKTGKESPPVSAEVQYHAPQINDFGIDCGNPPQCLSDGIDYLVRFRPQHGVQFETSIRHTPLLGSPGAPSLITPDQGKVIPLLNEEGVVTLVLTTGNGQKEQVNLELLLRGPGGEQRKSIRFLQE